MKSTPNTWSNLPAEMQAFDQWIVANPDKVPYIADLQTGECKKADPAKGPWMSFENACKFAAQMGWCIGFVLTADDPFACIDLDVKDCQSVDAYGDIVQASKWTPPTQLDMYTRMIEVFASFTEVSSSGKGAHIWVKGNIGKGVRRDHVEVYSQQRYILTTGWAVSELHFTRGMDFIVKHSHINMNPLPLQDRNEILNNMVDDMRRDRGVEVELQEIKETVTDEELWKRAAHADNGTKFVDLCNGDWARYNYPSQSEADLSLMSMFTYYSNSNAQCRRMFRQTVLGQREKAVKDDRYLNYTLRLIRSRQAREAEVESAIKIDRQALGQMCMNALRDSFNQPQQDYDEPTLQQINEVPNNAPVIQLQIPDFREHMEEPVCLPQDKDDTRSEPDLVAAGVAAMQNPVIEDSASKLIDHIPAKVDGLAWPPGVVGYVAEHMYNNAPRPVKEVAIVAALGLFAGMLGKAYNVSRTGLNLYIVLIARSAIGKEAMHSGLSQVLNDIRGGCTYVDNMVDFNNYVSAPALIKRASAENGNCFVNIAGEFGRKLKRMSMDNERDAGMAQLRTIMTDLYQKSGYGMTVGGLGYSNKDDNIASTTGIAYSMIGETTPGTFYDSLTTTMMEDGFLSRFNIIQYDGERPKRNRNNPQSLPEEARRYLQGMIGQAVNIMSKNSVMHINFSDDAFAMSEALDARCDVEINKTDDERWRQMWNRAHLKTLRIAGLLAVADNFNAPCIQKHHFEWAESVVMQDIAIMTKRINDGDVGMDDNSRTSKVHSLFKTAITKGASKSMVAQIKNLDVMVANGVLPRRYLQLKTFQVSSFANYRLGSGQALEHTLRDMISQGIIVQVPRAEAIANYSYHGDLYQLVMT